VSSLSCVHHIVDPKVRQEIIRQLFKEESLFGLSRQIVREIGDRPFKIVSAEFKGGRTVLVAGLKLDRSLYTGVLETAEKLPPGAYFLVKHGEGRFSWRKCECDFQVDESEKCFEHWRAFSEEFLEEKDEETIILIK